jgi:hypothetical protein
MVLEGETKVEAEVKVEEYFEIPCSIVLKS